MASSSETGMTQSAPQVNLAHKEDLLRKVAWLGFLLVAAIFVLAFFIPIPVGAGPEETSWGSSGVVVQYLFVLSTISFPVVAILILTRQPRNSIGWILLAVGLTWALDGLLSSYGGYAKANGHSLAALAVALDSFLWVPAIGLIGTFLMLLFPTGHLPSPRWKNFAWLSAATMILSSLGILFRAGSLADSGYPELTNPLGLKTADWLLAPLQWLLILFPLLIIGSVVSLVLRFRRSRGTARLQLKWLTVGAMAVALIYLIAMIGSLGFGSDTGSDPTWVQLVQDVALFSFMLIPTAIGIAILKHRLFDIDVVINKTLVFGALAAFITAVYVAIVVGIGSAIGQGSKPNLPLSIAATAVVAVAFQPVRERVQRFANRLVYGKRATPYEVLSRFAETIASSYGVEELMPRTAETLRDATASSAASVWLAVGDHLLLAARSPQDDQPLEARPLSAGELPQVPGEYAAPIRDGGELLGALSITKDEEAMTSTDRELLNHLADQAGQIVRNARLTTDLQARLAELAMQAKELRESRQRIVAVQDDERRALERNIHDGAQQHLVALAVKLKLTRTLATRTPEKAVTMLGQLRGEVSDTLVALRELALGIYPAALEEGGIAHALEVQTKGSPLVTTIDSDGAGRYPLEIEATVYFCCLEALQNIAKYAHASAARVLLRDEDGSITFSVEDDGVGFDPATITHGSGLRNISDRVAAARGTLQILSAPGNGTRISARIPADQLQVVT
jgi:signal transduction histidine kinase